MVNAGGERNADDDGQGAGYAAQRSRGQGHAIIQGGPAAGVQGIHGTGAGAALAPGSAWMVDAGVRNGRARRRPLPLALAERQGLERVRLLWHVSRGAAAINARAHPDVRPGNPRRRSPSELRESTVDVID